MPFVRAEEALNRPLVSLGALPMSTGDIVRIPVVGTPRIRMVLLRWAAGHREAAHAHPHADEVFHLLEGRAGFTLGDEPEVLASAGDVVLAPRGLVHSIRVTDDGPLRFLAIVTPNEDRPDEVIEHD